MKISFQVTLHAGPRTDTHVDIYCRSYKKKIITFKNGKKIEDEHIMLWISRELEKAVDKVKGIQQRKE